MWKRVLLSLTLAALPAGALADDALSTPAPNPLQSTADSGSSNAAGSALQPAGINPLQSTTQDNSGPSAGAALQAPASNDGSLQVLLNGETDPGSRQAVATDANAGANLWSWLGLGLGLALLAGVVWWWFRQRHLHVVAAPIDLERHLIEPPAPETDASPDTPTPEASDHQD